MIKLSYDDYIDLAPGCWGLIARRVAPHRYAIYVAEGEGYGAGEPWCQVGDGEVDYESRTLVLTALRAHDPSAELIDEAPDDLDIACFHSPDELFLVDDEDGEYLANAPDEVLGRLVTAENGDWFAAFASPRDPTDEERELRGLDS